MRTIWRLKRLALIGASLSFCFLAHSQELPTSELIAELPIIDTRGQPLILKNVTIRRVDPDGLSLMHESGTTKVSFERLPEFLRQKYAYNPSKAKEFAQLDDKQRTAAELALEREVSIAKSKEDAQKLESRTREQAEKKLADLTAQQMKSAQARDHAERNQADAELSAREAALRQMEKAIRSHKAYDVAKALRMLQTSAPDAVKGYTDYLAASAKSAQGSRLDEIEGSVRRIESNTRR
jgi:hypothetical protein